MIKKLVGILIILQFVLGQHTEEGIPYSQIYGLENNTFLEIAFSYLEVVIQQSR